MANLDSVDYLSDIRKLTSIMALFFKVIKPFRGTKTRLETLINRVSIEEKIWKTAFFSAKQVLIPINIWHVTRKETKEIAREVEFDQRNRALT